MSDTPLEDVWRSEAPHVLARLLRQHGDFADCEDALQLALIAASEQWPRSGVPTNPGGWLMVVARRRLVDQIRADASRREREERAARLDAASRGSAAALETVPSEAEDATDDTLHLMVLCAHPRLTPSSQAALMLRAVAGLTTGEIAAGFLVPEATVAQRISRAKATLWRSGARLSAPTRAELPVRLLAVRHAISLLYTRAHLPQTGIAGTDRPLLARTALRLARALLRLAPDDPENAGLLAMLMLTHARAQALLDETGDLVPLDEQDRTRWDARLVAEGVALLERTLPVGYVGAFQLRAAIAAVHAEAADAASTDWPQILALYDMLEQVEPSAAVALGRAVAVAETHGSEAGLAMLDDLADDSHRVHAARGHMLLRLGRTQEASAAFARASESTRSIPEQRYLNRMVASCEARQDGHQPRREATT